MQHPLRKEGKAGLDKLYMSQGARAYSFNFAIFQGRIKFYCGFSKALPYRLSAKYVKKEDRGRWKQSTVKKGKVHQGEDAIPVFPLTPSRLVLLSPEAQVVGRKVAEVSAQHELTSFPSLFSILLLKLM